MFIEVKNALKKYGKDESLVYALNDASFSLEQGKVCIILGPSGSGKSTLLNMLGGLDSLDDGEVIVDGINLCKLSKKELTKYRKEKVGFVFQFYNLINDLSAKENIEAVRDLNKKTSLNIDTLMEDLEISNLQKRFPKELSGGQQQRVAIARAMVKNPAILLCDELTGALDSKSSISVLKAIEKLNELYHTTIIIITHNEKISLIGDVIIKIKDGKISEEVKNDHKLKVSDLEL